MNTFKDTDLREALRRRYADTPQLPDDFMLRMHRTMDEQAKQTSHRRWIRFCIVSLSAAAVLVLGFFLLKPGAENDSSWSKDFSQEKIIVAESSSETEQPSASPVPLEKITLKDAKERPQSKLSKKVSPRRYTVSLDDQKVAEMNTSEVIKDETPVPLTITVLDEKDNQHPIGIIPADKLVFTDILLAEEALQVAYELQAQQEAIHGYAVGITGEKTPPTIYLLCRRAREYGFFMHKDSKEKLEQLKRDIKMMEDKSISPADCYYLHLAFEELEKIE